MAKSKDQDEIEVKENILIQAHNAMIEWGMLKCEHGRMKLPIKFVLAMEELDRDVDRLAEIKRNADKKLIEKMT